MDSGMFRGLGRDLIGCAFALVVAGVLIGAGVGWTLSRVIPRTPPAPRAMPSADCECEATFGRPCHCGALGGCPCFRKGE